MKAAVLHQFGETPRYEDFPDPLPQDDEILVRVKAIALENVDRMMASGTHFASRQFLSELPAVLGTGGIGEREDGKLIGFGGVHPPFGAMAEVAVVPEAHQAPIPEGIAASIATTVPSSALTSLFPLKWGVQFEPGWNVLVNGATGFAGRLAVQIARLLGAGRVVGTGRDAGALDALADLGADAVIDLTQPDEELAAAYAREAGDGYQVILDYLWGRPTEILVQTLVPRKLALTGCRTYLVQIGEKAGADISLPAGALRTSGLVIQGAATGLLPETISEGTKQVWDWLAAGKLRAEVEEVPLRDIAHAWSRRELHGKRIVLVP